MPSKREMAEFLASTLSWGSKERQAEQARLMQYHLGRDIQDVQESYQRWKAINKTTQAEINRHCQFEGLPRVAA